MLSIHCKLVMSAGDSYNNLVQKKYPCKAGAKVGRRFHFVSKCVRKIIQKQCSKKTFFLHISPAMHNIIR